MSNKNKHNSIVFLTTLSVYLGLVLVGATPQSLAQSSDNKVLNCFNIERNKVVLGDLKLTYSFVNLAKDIRKLAGIEKFNSSSDIGSYTKYYNFCNSVSGSSVEGNQWLGLAFDEAINVLNNQLLCELSDFSRDDSLFRYRYLVKYDLNSSDFVITISLQKSSEAKAQQLAENLNNQFTLNSCESTEASIRQIYEKTNATAIKKETLIVTHLPRGSLDELLKNAKAESE